MSPSASWWWCTRGRVEQRQAQRWTFVGSGTTHPDLLATLGALHLGARDRIESAAAAYY